MTTLREQARQFETDVEAMIDRHGLVYVVTLLSLIASEKASHIRENWQDKQTARAWVTDSNALEECARKLKT